METLKSQINLQKLPEHVAVIMDGNGRWAKKRMQPRVFGHKNGVKAVREITEASAELGIKYLTLYAFSTENWNRPSFEVNTLMRLLVDTIGKEVKTLNKNNIRLHAIGDLSKLPSKTRAALLKGIESTKNNTRMDLILALNYSGRWDILNATQKIANQVKNQELDPSQITEDTFKSALSTANFPDPELMIRTSGETRLSNFLLWELSYAEFQFLPLFWPDFQKKHLYECILNFQNKERRFGMISEQLV
jgi:undecaprenyl diphosphate synthase